MSGLILGIDLGGTNMQLGMVNNAGEIIAQHKKKTRAVDGPDAVFERLVLAIQEICVSANVPPAELDAIGLAAAAALDHRTGVIVEAPNIGWRDFPIARLCSGTARSSCRTW
jgi:glucokinase